MPKKGEGIIFRPKNGQDMNYHVKQASAEMGEQKKPMWTTQPLNREQDMLQYAQDVQ